MFLSNFAKEREDGLFEKTARAIDECALEQMD